jgi:hypothetical protein
MQRYLQQQCCFDRDMSKNNKSAIRKLRRNDPDYVQDRLHLDEFTRASAQDCAAALLQNTSCKGLNLYDAGRPPPPMDDADWVPFYNAIATSSVLVHVRIHKCERGTFHSDRFLEAIARSSSIKQLDLYGGTFLDVESFATFLRTTTSVTTLELVGVRFQETLHPAEAALHLSASVAANSSLEVLECRLFDRLYRDAIFRGLAEHTKIKVLALRDLSLYLPQRLNEVEALGLAMTAKTLVDVKFYNCYFYENWFPVILQRIRESRSVCQISLFAKCRLDAGSTRLLQDLFTTVPADKLYSFHFSPNITFSKFIYTFFREVLHSNTCMSELTLHQHKHDDSVVGIASAVEEYAGPALKSLTIPVYGHRQFRSLTWCLPKMKHLRKLNLSVRGGEITGSVAMLLHALKRNCSLWQVTADLAVDMPEGETKKLEFYAKRNKHIHAILEAPKTGVQLLSAWPRVIRAVGGCEMESSIILAALSALGEPVGRTWDRESSASKSPKRKRGSSSDEVASGGPN